MDADDILDRTERRAGVDSRAAAERAVLATLTTIGEQVEAGDAQRIAARLPGEIGDAAASRSSASPDVFDVEEFAARVASREGDGVATDEAVGHVRAVVEVLAEAGVRDELADVRGQLPNDFAALFGEDPPGE